MCESVKAIKDDIEPRKLKDKTNNERKDGEENGREKKKETEKICGIVKKINFKIKTNHS